MVSSSHEALHRIFQEDPGAMPRALQQLLGLPFPEPDRSFVVSPDLTEIAPIERRVDTLLQVNTKEQGSYLLAIESQSRRDPDKPAAWAYYLSYLHAKFRHQPVLIVLCPDVTTARWAARPITLGVPGHPSLTVRPLVLGPDNTPVITDAREAARDVPIAVFSALTHSKRPDADAILKALASALDTIDADQATNYSEFIEAGLGNTPARQTWRELMSTLTSFFRSETAVRALNEARSEGKAEGKAEGTAEAILRFLDARGLDVRPEDRERIRTCTDLEALDVWLNRAATVSRSEDLFADK
ncbi:hypothetical protein [Streptomyces sp. GC420]|uniref:hypothetical protein n=1 Tax=Streptomyces sp. GC420 TaxID=2697568 RepID=UPI001415039A|nr:hypothetical protein [Streptomyces sp. GC420]NBM20127.1 hypothetical protein [Streptomyces sp. GC420]